MRKIKPSRVRGIRTGEKRAATTKRAENRDQARRAVAASAARETRRRRRRGRQRIWTKTLRATGSKEAVLSSVSYQLPAVNTISNSKLFYEI